MRRAVWIFVAKLAFPIKKENLFRYRAGVRLDWNGVLTPTPCLSLYLASVQLVSSLEIVLMSSSYLPAKVTLKLQLLEFLRTTNNTRMAN